MFIYWNVVEIGLDLKGHVSFVISTLYKMEKKNVNLVLIIWCTCVVLNIMTMRQ